ncbi:transcriptional antitermination N peptide [Pantoea sp. A4]|uniref:transcriptional antitermination N peptide n=1 Tax=Pantoea sp. A4 TaxID=1225184 RepID=UPI000375170B|nr:hypothetical protein [Pantoea sp. A4]
MTAITYGSSVKETAKTRRHARRRAAAIERDGICSIIDTVFGIEPEVVAVTARPTNRVSRATSSPSLRDRHESGANCLPEVAIYAAGYRKSECVTAR